MLYFKLAILGWLLALLGCAVNKISFARLSLMFGTLIAIIGSINALPAGTDLAYLPIHLANTVIAFQLNAAALWLCGFGLVPALLACFVSNTTQSVATQRYWLAGTSCALIGALGVFGLTDALSFFIAWELMSFGVALMLLAEHKSAESASAILSMLAILEVGAIALLVALLLLSGNGDNMQFNAFAEHSAHFSAWKQGMIGLLLLIGFGAKLGLLPFYEWLPKAYSAGSGASGAIASGLILNAAFFGLMRGLMAWLPHPVESLGIIVVLAGVLTAVLTILYAFQQSDWRRLLSYSSAENAAISVLSLGIALLFRAEQQYPLEALAGIVALLHLAGHSLAKGALFLTADGVYCSTRRYDIKQNGLLKHSGWILGVGALFAVMSLSAMPPQAGFVSEWYVFQTIFHGFHLTNLANRYTLIIAGMGMALTAALALATFVKIFGIGLLGARTTVTQPLPKTIKIAVFILGLCVLALAVGMVEWLSALRVIALDWFQFDSASLMHSGWLLVPLNANFAFISPSLLVLVTPLLALIPILLILKNRHFPIKRAPIWYGGLQPEKNSAATSALTFSNAMHYFYRFIYLPRDKITCEYHSKPYFIKRVTFIHQSTALFSKYLFAPIVRGMIGLSTKMRLFQSGNLNFYNGIIGILLLLILMSVFFTP